MQRRKMTYRERIDASHERRMWLKDVVIPGAIALAFIDRMNPQLKYEIAGYVRNKKEQIKAKFTKNKES